MEYLGDTQRELKTEKRLKAICEEVKKLPKLEGKKADVGFYNHTANLVETMVKDTDCIDKEGFFGDVLQEVFGKQAFTQADRENALKTYRYLHQHKLIIKYDLWYKLALLARRFLCSKKA